ncbi:MAG: N-acetylmuramoyl-L-alanine amidase [Lachnospiraceae bacterium]|nr:N-acetylmuramoyl-L-alanine amidase [Lachnospiraceae bacterium]
MRKIICIIVFLVLLYVPCERVMANELFPKKDKYIIVIDPGHGGENLGTESNPNYKEKDIIMKTAQALVEELKKYEEFEVYLTREEDIDIELHERAKFAKSVNADFLFSLHYNASENHTLFGTEVWIPLYAPFHGYGYKFAYLQQLQMQDLGLFSRGIRTRKGDDNKDYYGIIRECAARNIPAVIIEHCYIDESRDAIYCDEDSDFEEFGRRDAIAIAKFFGVHEDLSDIPEELYKISKNTIVSHTLEDHSGPNVCTITEEHADYENGVLTVQVKATDKNTQIMYYTYSIDGGKTFSKFYPWPDSDLLTGEQKLSVSLMLSIPDGHIPKVAVRAYSKNEFYNTSNILKGFDAFITPTAPPALQAPLKEVVMQKETVDNEKRSVVSIFKVVNLQPEKFKLSIKRFWLLLLFIFFWVFWLLLGVRFLYRYFQKKTDERKH